MNKKKIIVFTILLLVIAGFLGYKYLYQDHRDIKNETAQIELNAPELLDRFRKNDANAILNETVLVKGRITDIEDNAITLDKSIYASFAKIPDLKINEQVKIKGRCIGYDELFEIVKLDQCSIIK